MDRTLITHLPAVLAVARTRSFARAAAELDVGASAVSHAVRTVEQRLGQPLFARTTRSVSLTEAGESFVRSAQQAFDDLDAATEAMRAGQPEITGTLRINAPRIALYLGLIPILERLAVEHPKLTVEVIADDALTDVVAEGFDAGIRLGEMIAQDMVALRLTAPLRAIMVASPAYLDARGTPASIGDLGKHNCIGFRLLASGAIYAWDLQEGGKNVKVSVSGTVRVSDPSFRASSRSSASASLIFSNRWLAPTLRRAASSKCCPPLRSRSQGCSSTFPAMRRKRPNCARSST